MTPLPPRSVAAGKKLLGSRQGLARKSRNANGPVPELIGSMRDRDARPRWSFSLGASMGEAGRLSVEVAAVMPRIAVPS